MELSKKQYIKLIAIIERFPEIADDLELERNSAYRLKLKDYDKIIKLKKHYEKKYIEKAEAVEKAQDLAVVIENALKAKRRTEEDVFKAPYKWTKR